MSLVVRIAIEELDNIMSEDWKIGYKKALLDVLIEKGGVHNGKEDWQNLYGGWQDYEKTNELREHLKGICNIKPELSGNIKDIEWEEFDSTFGPNRTIHAISAEITCYCKKFNKSKVILEITFADLLKYILEV